MSSFREEGDEQGLEDDIVFCRSKGLEWEFVRNLSKDEADEFVRSKKDREMVRL
jgi:hypothetical protein